MRAIARSRNEIYAPIHKLTGEEGEDGVDLERDLRRLNRNSREELAAIRGVDPSSITEYRD